MLPTLCQPSQKLTSGWSGKIFIVDWSQTGFKDEPSFMLMDVASEAQACLFSS